MRLGLQRRGEELVGPCPACGGEDRFRVTARGGFFCRQCCPDGSGMEAVRRIHEAAGFSFPDLGRASSLEGRSTTKANGKAKSDRPPDYVVMAGRAPDHQWTYEDAGGKPVVQVWKWDAEKIFRPAPPGMTWQPEWKPPRVNDLKPEAGWPLLGLPAILADLAATLLVVEGEKTRDAAAKLGLPAVVTTAKGGSAETDNADWSPAYFRRVVIWPDNDDPGHKHARKAAQACLATVANEVRIVKTDGLPVAWDLADPPPDGFDIRAAFDAAAPVELKTAPIDPEGRGITEADTARALAERQGDDFRWGENLGWHLWGGTHWQREGAKSALRKALADLIHESGDRAGRRSGFLGGAATYAEIISPFYRPVTDWQAALERDHELNLLNGVLNLETGELRRHSRDDLFTAVADVEWQPDPDPRADDLWAMFVAGIVPDEAERRLLQTFLGYCLSGRIESHQFAMIIGKTGTGKSTLIEALRGVYGSHCTQIGAEMLMRHGAGHHETELMQFRGRRLAIAPELPRAASLETARVNALTGDATITGRYMRADHVTYRRTSKLLLAGNHRPNFGDAHGDGIERRLLLFQCPAARHEDDQDPLLGRRLAEPDARAAILRWLVEGYAAYRDAGYRLELPASMKERRQEAFAEDDPLGDFLEEAIVDDPRGTLPSATLYQAYDQWCERVGQNRWSQKALSKALVDGRGWPKPDRLPRDEHGNQVRGYMGKRCIFSTFGAS